MNVNEPEITSVTDLTDRELSNRWKSVDWKRVEKFVNNLQSRIASAAKNNDWKKVSKLSRLLTRSFYARLLAVRKVSGNKGSKTPGVDGKLWLSMSDKMRAALLLKSKGYHAKPLTRKYIKKKNGKLRPLSIPTLYDRAMQTLHGFALNAVESATGDKTSFGFKPYRSTKDAYAYLHTCLSKKNAPLWIVEGDIKSCFDEISHDWIIENTPMNKQVLREFLNAGYVEDFHLFPTEKGTPQGGSGATSKAVSWIAVKFRHSIHSECPYSDVHFWQRICAELGEQSGVRMNLTTPNRQGEGHMENRKVKFPRGRDLQHAKAG